MTIKEAISQVGSDKQGLERALSDLETVEALYAVGEGEKAIELYGAVRSRMTLAFRSFPVIGRMQ